MKRIFILLTLLMMSLITCAQRINFDNLELGTETEIDKMNLTKISFGNLNGVRLVVPYKDTLSVITFIPHNLSGQPLDVSLKTIQSFKKFIETKYNVYLEFQKSEKYSDPFSGDYVAYKSDKKEDGTYLYNQKITLRVKPNKKKKYPYNISLSFIEVHLADKVLTTMKEFLNYENSLDNVSKTLSFQGINLRGNAYNNIHNKQVVFEKNIGLLSTRVDDGMVTLIEFVPGNDIYGEIYYSMTKVQKFKKSIEFLYEVNLEKEDLDIPDINDPYSGFYSAIVDCKDDNGNVISKQKISLQLIYKKSFFGHPFRLHLYFLDMEYRKSIAHSVLMDVFDKNNSLKKIDELNKSSSLRIANVVLRDDLTKLPKRLSLGDFYGNVNVEVIDNKISKIIYSPNNFDSESGLFETKEIAQFKMLIEKKYNCQLSFSPFSNSNDPLSGKYVAIRNCKHHNKKEIDVYQSISLIINKKENDSAAKYEMKLILSDQDLNKVENTKKLNYKK